LKYFSTSLFDVVKTKRRKKKMCDCVKTAELWEVCKNCHTGDMKKLTEFIESNDGEFPEKIEVKIC